MLYVFKFLCYTKVRLILKQGEILMEKYTLKEYLQLLKEADLVIDFDLKGADETVIQYLTYNSKAAVKDTFFICKGATFKEEYLLDAVNRGACAYVSEKPYSKADDIPYIIVKDIRLAMPPLADKYNNSPWKKLKLTGFGGTKGKSTSAYYMKAIVDDFMSATGGKRSAIISSVATYDGVVDKESHITTPEVVELQEHFSNAVKSGITFAEMEVSSQALKYNRIDNITLDVGVFLNISEDHISPIEHPDFDDYFSSKLKIFDHCKNAVVNMDADFAEKIIESSSVCENIYTISAKNPEADFYAYDITKDGIETVFMVKGPGFDEKFALTMPGLFNIENALAAIAAATFLEIPMQYIKSGLYRARTSGRMELFISRDKKIIAIVDYAHNKLSFEKLFASTKKEYPEYDIVSVFGCPGGKAFNRRKDLGLIAGAYSKYVYLVAEDPGNEPYEKIADEIAVYLEEQDCPYEFIEDRGEAIKVAIDNTKVKTVLLITGKGNETRQKYGNSYIECRSDVDYVKEYLDM